MVVVSLSMVCSHAFVPTSTTGRMSAVKPLKKMSDDVGIPCEDECALESFPNLPESVHPGVLSGKAMMDLLKHAKENGTSLWIACYISIRCDTDSLFPPLFVYSSRPQDMPFLP